MPKINIVLVEPQIPQNTGSIARTCAATGARLHLVGPMGFKIDDTKLKRAGLDYWHYLDITEYENIDEFFNKNNGDFYFFSTKAKKVYSKFEYKDNCYLLFGGETKGLPEELLYENSEACARMPMMGGLRSLNLSNTVSIAVYEVLRQWNFPELQNEGELTKYNWNC